MEWSLSTVTVLFALFQVSSAFRYVQIYSQLNRSSYVAAEEACQSNNGGHLVSVKSKEEEVEIQNLLKSFGDFKPKDCMLTGLLKVNNEWKWRDNTTADYINWAPGFPKKEGRCACYKVIKGKARMLNTYCLNAKSNFYSCEPGPVAEMNMAKERLPTTKDTKPAVTKYYCDERWSFFNQSCFKEFYGAPVKKWEAEATCQQMGAELATFGSEEKREFLAELSEWGNYREFGSPAWVQDSSLIVKEPTFHTWQRPKNQFYFPIHNCVQLIVRPGTGIMDIEEHPGEVDYFVDCDSTTSRFFCEHPMTKTIKY